MLDPNQARWRNYCKEHPDDSENISVTWEDYENHKHISLVALAMKKTKSEKAQHSAEVLLELFKKSGTLAVDATDDIYYKVWETGNGQKSNELSLCTNIEKSQSKEIFKLL